MESNITAINISLNNGTHNGNPFIYLNSIQEVNRQNTVLINITISNMYFDKSSFLEMNDKKNYVFVYRMIFTKVSSSLNNNHDFNNFHSFLIIFNEKFLDINNTASFIRFNNNMQNLFLSSLFFSNGVANQRYKIKLYFS